MEWHHQLITSLEDLMGRVSTLADSGVIQGSGFDVEENLLLIAGIPSRTQELLTSDQLAQLMPIYVRAIRDMKEKGEESIILRPIMEQTETKEKPEAAFILLSFLDLATIQARFNNRLNNQLIDVSDSIVCCYPLQHWCRRVVSNYNRHHILVVIQAISILATICPFVDETNKKMKKLVRKVLLEGNESSEKGFLKLHNTLASLVLDLCPELPFEAIANTIIIQKNVWSILTNGDARVTVQKLKDAPNRKVFLKALEKHKGSKRTERTLQSMRLLLGDTQHGMSHIEIANTKLDMRANMAPLSNKVTCGRPGCLNPAEKRCANCHLVSYCCRDCQRMDWKNGHSAVCKKGGLSRSKVRAASVRMRDMRPALQIQESMQSGNPGVDYCVRLPNSDHVNTVVITDTPLKALYSNARKEQNVQDMYLCLCKATTNYDGTESFPDVHSLLAEQLQEEYGVDPRFAVAAGLDTSS